MGDRRRARQHPQPAERIDLLVCAQDVGRDRPAADAVEAVAAGDEVAVDAVDVAAPAIRESGRIGLDVVGRHVFGLMDDDAAGGIPRFEEVARDLGLAVDRDARSG